MFTMTTEKGIFMVILLSGTTRTGKTLMAQTLMEKHNIPYMSVDHLKMGLYRGLGDEKYNPEQKYTVLGETLWPVIKGIILTAVENEQNLIIEGCYILPHMIKDIKKEYSKHVIPVFIGFTENYIRNNYRKKIVGYQNIIEKRENDMLEKADCLIQLHSELKKRCEKDNIKMFEIDNDYEIEIEFAYKFIDSKINLLK